jgi:hypothetical protein
MKKIYLSIVAIVSVITANAQLTQGNNAPVNGEIYNFYQCDSVAPGAAGTAMTWNFAVSNRTTVVNNYTASTINSPTYPSANIGVALNASNTAYYASSANSLLYYGGNISAGLISASLIYTVPAVHAMYPMSLGTTTTTQISGQISVVSPLTASGSFSGTAITACDGTGTLTVAGMTFTNVLRVSINETMAFTTNVAPGNLTRITTRYFQAGIKQPIMSVETVTGSTLLGVNSQTIAIRITAMPTSTIGGDVGIANQDAATGSIKVFPNPASSELTVFAANEEAAVISIFDVTGKTLAKTAVSSVWTKIDVSEYNKGLYIYRVETANGRALQTGKFTVVH